MIIKSLDTPKVRDRIKRISAFSKSGDSILRLQVDFKCYACFPNDLPTQASDYGVLKQRSTAMRQEFEQEFQEKLVIVKQELEIQKRLSVDYDKNIEEEEEDDEDKADWEDECALPDKDWRKTRCPHKRGWPGRRIIFKDSQKIINGSLGKLTDEMVQSALQPTLCQAFPKPPPNAKYPETVIWLGGPKPCECCRELFCVSRDAREVTYFSERMLGDCRHSDILLQKLSHFPYHMLDLGTEYLESSEEFPTVELFTNSLKDNAPIETAAYDQLKQNLAKIGVQDGMSMLVLYQSVDVISLLLLLQISTQFMFRTFGLNLLRYTSISRFANDVLVRHACKVVKGGLEHIPTDVLYRLAKRSLFGGFSQNNDYGTLKIPNMRYSATFDPDKDQSLYIALDKTSHYPTALTKAHPFSHYRYLSPDSNIIREMNISLSDDSYTNFASYCQNIAQKHFHLVLEVEISFPPSVQDALSAFVPTMRKTKVSLEWLSESQRKLVQTLTVNSLTNEINVSDFSVQIQVLSWPYLELLLKLGVCVNKVISGFTALQYPIFKDQITRMISLKMNAKGAFFRNWMKLAANSAFGYLILKLS